MTIDFYDELDTDERLEALKGWTFAFTNDGECRGLHLDGRRTALKGTTRSKIMQRNSQQWAERDAIAGRIVCARWPACEHGSPEQCARQSTHAQMRAPRKALEAVPVAKSQHTLPAAVIAMQRLLADEFADIEAFERELDAAA